MPDITGKNLAAADLIAAFVSSMCREYLLYHERPFEQK
jgi:hypothetical protein